MQHIGVDKRDALGVVESVQRAHIRDHRNGGEDDAVEDDGCVAERLHAHGRAVAVVVVEPLAAQVEDRGARLSASLERGVVEAPDPPALARAVPPEDIEGDRGGHVLRKDHEVEREGRAELQPALGGHRAHAEHNEEASELPHRVEVLVERREVRKVEEQVPPDDARVGGEDSRDDVPLPVRARTPALCAAECREEHGERREYHGEQQQHPIQE